MIEVCGKQICRTNFKGFCYHVCHPLSIAPKAVIFEISEFFTHVVSRNASWFQNLNKIGMRLVVGLIYLASGSSPMFPIETQKHLITEYSSKEDLLRKSSKERDREGEETTRGSLLKRGERGSLFLSC